MKSSVKDRTLPCLNENQVEANINDVLNSCIQIEESKISRRNTAPQQIRFHLNAEVLIQIEQARAKNLRLNLSQAKLTDIQYYVLLNSSSEYNRANHVKLASGQFAMKQCPRLAPRSHLTFSTDYSLLNQQAKTLFRSSIDLKGAISQQIQQDLWQNQQLLEQISQAHYWLIAEILAQLPLKRKSQKLWAFTAFSLFVASLITIILWYFLNLNILFELLIFLCLLLVLNFCLKRFVVKSIRKLMIDNLVNRRFCKSIKMRQFSWKVIRLVVD